MSAGARGEGEEAARGEAAAGGAASSEPVPSTAAAVPRAARWLAWLFAALCLVQLAPIWSVTYLPMIDGPSHLYNAWILKHIGDSAHFPRLAEVYEVMPLPVPNWLCYALTWLLLFVAPPLVAEKILVSAIVLLWLFGWWYLAGAVERERRWVAFLGFAFVYNIFFQFGFWNFCLSLGFFMLAVGYWWRRRRQPGLRTALVLNGILLLCYFSHILSLELALAAIGLLWLCTFERQSWRRHLLHVAWLAPQALLPLWFMLRHSGQVAPSATPVRRMLQYMFHFEGLVTFAQGLQINDWVAAAFALLVVLTLVERLRNWRARAAAAPPASPGPGRPPPRRLARAVARLRGLVREEDAFLLLAFLLTLVFLFAPEGMAGGSILKPRLALYPWLALLSWLSVRLAPPARLVGAGLLAVPGMVQLHHAWHCYRQMDPILIAFVHTLDPVAPGSGVLPLYFEHPGFCVRGGVLGHTIDYAAVAKGLIEWGNYEAATDLFPLRFKPGISEQRPDTYTVEALPNELRVVRGLALDDYIFTFGMPDKAPVRRRIRRFYDQVHELGPVRLFARRPREKWQWPSGNVAQDHPR